MASYLRPRRGKKATAESQNIILKRGEVFFEAPTGGVGTGTGRIKVGDGTTAYTSLPYFLNPDNFVSDISTATVTFTETAETNNATLLSRIVTGAGLNTIVASVKNLLSNLNSSVTSINNDLTANNTPFRFGYDSALGAYGYIINEGGADTVIPFKSGAEIPPINPNHIVSLDYCILFYAKNSAVANVAFPCSGYRKLYLYGDAYDHTQSTHNANFSNAKYHWIYDDGTVSADATLLTLVPTIRTWTEISIPQNAIGIYFICTKTSTGTWIYYSMTV